MNMKSDTKMISNTKQILKILVISPIVWFGTFGDNQICLNFTIFFSIFAGIVLCAYILGKEKLEDSLTKEELSNDFLNAFSWLIPASLLIADGWIITGMIWFLCWLFSISIRKVVMNKEQ